MTNNNNNRPLRHTPSRVISLIRMGLLGAMMLWVLGQSSTLAAAKSANTEPAVASLGKAALPAWVRGTPAQLQDGQAPLTPTGLPRCSHPLEAVGGMPALPGETIRYVVDVDGLSLGTIDFKIERRGVFEGQPTIEYRSLFKLDALVASFVPVEGRAATLVTETAFWPRKAMNRYRMADAEIEENMTYSQEGRGVSATRVKDGQPKEDHRNFPIAVQDFVSGFYLLRRVSAAKDSCAIIYGNQRAYTVWVSPQGQEDVKTPVGLRKADRYEIRYASDKSPKMLVGRVWLGTDPDRLPYRAELDGAHKVEAHIYLYQAGKITTGPITAIK